MSYMPLTITELAHIIHTNNVTVGWWDDSITYTGTIPDKYMISTKLCLAHSEISEALEGHRKNLMDDHLPHRKMLEVEIADAIIRLLDIAGYYSFDIGTAIAEKLEYNSHRVDHQREARQQPDGKQV